MPRNDRKCKYTVQHVKGSFLISENLWICHDPGAAQYEKTPGDTYQNAPSPAAVNDASLVLIVLGSYVDNLRKNNPKGEKSWSIILMCCHPQFKPTAIDFHSRILLSFLL